MTGAVAVSPITGGCQCGAVRYLIVGGMPPCHACHCRACQKQSASAFGLSLAVARKAFAVTGPVRRWDRPNDPGGRTTCVFCVECGTRVFHIDSVTPHQVSVKGGSLDDITLAVPSAHIWVSRKLDWVVLDPTVPTHPTQPDDMAAWRAGFADGRFIQAPACAGERTRGAAAWRTAGERRF